MEQKIYPKVSVILPSLNVKPYISECMDSVISQTLKEIEIICVDAGSTDGTLEILEEYAAKDSRITIIHSDKKSYGYQMNLGIKAAKGQYIGIVETDDYVTADMFEKLYKLGKDVNADFIKGGYISFFDCKDGRIKIPFLNGRCKGLYGKYIDLKQNREAGMYDLTQIWAGIYRREFLLDKEVRFHESPGASYQDTSFSILVGLTADSCIFTDDCSYYYRIDNVQSSINSDSKIECVRDEYAYVDDYLERHNAATEEIKRMIAKYKLFTYRWNYDRLGEQGRRQFLGAISEEMKSYLPGGVYADALDDIDRMRLGVLTDPAYARSIMLKEEEVDKVYLNLFIKIDAGKKFIVMGAGKYFETIVFIENIFNKNFISGVCDNNPSVQGTEKNGYCITSVEDAMRKNPNGEWLVASKHYSSEMSLQLQSLGIEPDKIYPINVFIEYGRLLRLIRNYKTDHLQ